MEESSYNNELPTVYGRALKEAVGKLDEQQAVSFVERLIGEREKLVARQEHLDSLAKHYEMVIIEAEQFAKKISQEAIEKAEVEKKVILAKAEEQAHQVFVEKKARALGMLRKEMEKITALVETELESQTRKVVANICLQIKDATQRLSDEVLPALDVTQPQEQIDLVINEKFIDHESLGNLASKEENVTKLPEYSSVEKGGQAKAPESRFEEFTFEILPPRDAVKINAIKSSLDALDGVINSEIKHLPNSTLVTVTMSKPINIVEALSNLPEIEDVQQVANNGRLLKTQVILNVRSELARDKEEINERINRIASRVKVKGLGK